ncbi:hypothetical protein B0H15DRAFT_988675 [Mycena belliarum]|uniref:Uncharacterized protein n=1 Tax=Mycena belliarum TaxID=1033014 RepID=A0AAD6U5B4_9AGAR|nr:hypothetical protein B0H15DRAFT_988675 [Mycena belliae]
MRFMSFAAAATLALARAAPPDPRQLQGDTPGIAARSILETYESYETYTRAQQAEYVARHCADLGASRLAKIAAEPDVAETLNDHGIRVGTVIAYVAAICGTL